MTVWLSEIRRPKNYRQTPNSRHFRLMFRPLEIFIGLRYTRARRRNHFISFISLTSMLGIALGVTALITVLSVMNGFQQELRERILSMTSHASISSSTGVLRDWEGVIRAASRYPHVVGTAPYISGQAMLIHRGQVHGTYLRGVLPEQEPQVSEIPAYMQTGHLTDLVPGEFRILLGKELARALDVFPGQKITVVTPQASVTPAGILPRLKRFTVVGVFRVGMHEYDSAMALIHMQDAARLFQMGTAVSGVRLKLDDIFAAPYIVRQIQLPGNHWIVDWTQQHANFFRAVKIEKTMMFIILMLIVAVAAFNIVSTLVMMVTDKEADIAILRTLGATPRSVMMIFIVQGALIGLLGTLLGLAGGVSLAMNIETLVPKLEALLGTDFFPEDVYYISELPSKVQWSDVTVICGISLILAILATLYPALRAARTQPAEALRYE
jgi:lipoprotein-releasing system permease protein